jgi:hypothetical protein
LDLRAASSGPWQAKHLLARIGLTSRLKSTAARVEPPAASMIIAANADRIRSLVVVTNDSRRAFERQAIVILSAAKDLASTTDARAPKQNF